MGTSTNYTAGTARRRVDLYVMGPLDFASSETQLTAQSMEAASGGKVCAGIVKVAQKVVNTLLTNNAITDYSWGTDLGSLILSGQLGTIKANIGDILSAGIKYVESSLISEEDPKLPDDERISELTMLDWWLDVANSKLLASVSVITLNFESTQIIVPISIMP